LSKKAADPTVTTSTKPRHLAPEVEIPDDLVSHFRYVYEVFIEEEAPFEINISSTLRRQLKNDLVQRPLLSSIFDPAIDEVLSLIYLNTFREPLLLLETGSSLFSANELSQFSVDGNKHARSDEHDEFSDDENDEERLGDSLWSLKDALAEMEVLWASQQKVMEEERAAREAERERQLAAAKAAKEAARKRMEEMIAARLAEEEMNSKKNWERQGTPAESDGEDAGKNSETQKGGQETAESMDQLGSTKGKETVSSSRSPLASVFSSSTLIQTSASNSGAALSASSSTTARSIDTNFIPFGLQAPPRTISRVPRPARDDSKPSAQVPRTDIASSSSFAVTTTMPIESAFKPGVTITSYIQHSPATTRYSADSDHVPHQSQFSEPLRIIVIHRILFIDTIWILQIIFAVRFRSVTRSASASTPNPTPSAQCIATKCVEPFFSVGFWDGFTHISVFCVLFRFFPLQYHNVVSPWKIGGKHGWSSKTSNGHEQSTTYASPKINRNSSASIQQTGAEAEKCITLWVDGTGRNSRNSTRLFALHKQLAPCINAGSTSTESVSHTGFPFRLATTWRTATSLTIPSNAATYTAQRFINTRYGNNPSLIFIQVDAAYTASEDGDISNIITENFTNYG
ncbi:hypothetical protein HK102_003907, partial [Quaeritorhiza haematococci]